MPRIFYALFFLCLTAASVGAEPDWNQFRGPNHDNKCFTTGIAKAWPKGGPKLLWKIDDLGQGYSNLSFFGDTMFTMGDIGDECLLIAMDRSTGQRKWTAVVGDSGVVGRYYGPRSTPAVDGKRVFGYGQYGDFVCVDMETGKEIWGGDVVADLGGRYMNNWGYASSPIFDTVNGEELVLVPVGGDGGTLIAFKKDGKQAWRTKDLKDPAPYMSIVPATLVGKKQYLLFTGSGLYGVDPDGGGILWGTDRPSSRPVCSDPVFLDDIVLCASAYNMGANAYRISKDGEKFKADQVYADSKLLNHHGGIVLHDGHVYMTGERSLFCVDLKTGKIAWENRSVGKGSVTFVDDHLIVRSETGDGAIALIEATPLEYREKGRFDQPDRSDKNSWTYPVVVDGKMYLRDQNVLLCYELKSMIE